MESMQSVVTHIKTLKGEIDRGAVIRGLCTSTVVYISYRAVKFLISYRRWFNFFNDCQGIKEYSWRNGNLDHYPHDFEDRAKVEIEWMKKFPRYYRIWFGPFSPHIRCYHPDTLRAIVKSTEPKPVGKGAPYQPLLPWLGEGLLIAGGQRWARARRLLTPAFHFEILKPYVDITNDAIDIMLSKIDKHVAAGTSFDLFNMISLCSFDILLRCAMSVKENVQLLGDTHPYVKAVNDILETAVQRNRHLTSYFDFLYYNTQAGREFKKNCDYVHRIAEEIIAKRQQILEKEGPPKTRYLDFLDILLSARDGEGKGLTPLEIRNEVDTFLFEGHDTTTSGISWTLHTLASRPDIQARVQEELDSVLVDRESKHITWDDIPKLEYLNLCLRESMRYHSPVPMVSRRLENEMNIDGKVFPVGTVVTIGIWLVHHNPDVWEDPFKYDPDRFLPENFKLKDSYSYIPFSAGPRNCIGQHFALNEQKVIIGRVIERYDLVPDMSHKIHRRASGVMKAQDGLWVYAKHRKTASK